MTEYDDRDGNDRDDRPRGNPSAARARVGTPGMLMILAGVVALLCGLGFLGLALTQPTAIYDFYMDFAQKQPAGPQRDNLVSQIKAMETQLRLDAPMNLGLTALGLVANLLTIVGGFKMRSLSGYGLAMTGAVCALIPMGGCCCLTMPVGLWAMIVLAGADVKAAFARANRGGEYA